MTCRCEEPFPVQLSEGVYCARCSKRYRMNLWPVVITFALAVALAGGMVRYCAPAPALDKAKIMRAKLEYINARFD